MNFKFFREKEKEDPFIYTEEQLMVRLRFFIGVCLALTLTGIVFVVLYSIIFVTQPLNAMSPIDQKFFELIIPIATFLTGTLSGIMLASKDDKELRSKAIDAATRPITPTPPTPPGGLPAVKPSPSFGSATLGNNTVSTAPAFGAPPPPPPTFGSSPFGSVDPAPVAPPPPPPPPPPPKLS